MRRVVIDAAAFLAWFRGDAESLSLRREFEAGELTLIVPIAFTPDVMGLAAGLGWSADRLTRLGDAVASLPIERVEPSTGLLAVWLARGLEPRLAAYAALAEETGRPLVARDEELRRRAASVLLA